MEGRARGEMEGKETGEGEDVSKYIPMYFAYLHISSYTFLYLYILKIFVYTSIYVHIFQNTQY